MDSQVCKCGCCAHIRNKEEASMVAFVNGLDVDPGCLIMSMDVFFFISGCELLPRMCPLESCSLQSGQLLFLGMSPP